MIDKKHVLSEIRRTAEENGGRPLGRIRFLAETGIRESDWSGRYWARWSDAVREAGFEPNRKQVRSDDDANLEQLALEARRLGHLPMRRELQLRRREDSRFPSVSVFDRIGSKHAIASNLARYCETHQEYADVLALVLPLLDEPKQAESPGDDEAQERYEAGFVYLLKAGRNYKVGFTKHPVRREVELSNHLPDEGTMVHVIKCLDDAAGIEKYRHGRFAARFVKNEWFALTQADVRAFKRRKVM